MAHLLHPLNKLFEVILCLTDLLQNRFTGEAPVKFAPARRMRALGHRGVTGTAVDARVRPSPSRVNRAGAPPLSMGAGTIVGVGLGRLGRRGAGCEWI